MNPNSLVTLAAAPVAVDLAVAGRADLAVVFAGLAAVGGGLWAAGLSAAPGRPAAPADPLPMTIYPACGAADAVPAGRDVVCLDCLAAGPA